MSITGQTKPFTRFFLLLLLLCVWHGYVLADDEDDDDAASRSTAVEASGSHEVRWYQVELLIFKQKQEASGSDEVWPKNITLAYPEQGQTLKTASEYEAATQQTVHPNTPFILLDNSHFQLEGLTRNLRANHNEILLHAAWKQPLTQHLDQKGEGQGTAILIRGGERYDDHYELEGSVTLYLERYLHINTNLWLSHFVPASRGAGKSEAGWPALPDYPSTDSAAAPVAVERQFVVDEIALNQQSRKMRSHETHYIDHPKFGIFIRFVPLDGNRNVPSSRKK